MFGKLAEHTERLALNRTRRIMKFKAKLSVNTSLINKPDPASRAKNSARGWNSIEVNAEELGALVRAGYAFAPQYRNQHRKGSNFECAGFLAADCDQGLTVTEARDHAFVNSYAALIYTTASHTDHNHRFRIVLFLERPLEDDEEWSCAQRAIAHRLQTDATVTDKARCFFGNQAALVWIADKVLPNEVLEELIQTGRELGQARREGLPVDSTRRVDPSLIVTLADGNLVPLAEVSVGTSVRCPYHDDVRPSAFIVQSQTLGGTGIHCRACGLTYWQRAVDDYDFGAFEKMVERRIANPHASAQPQNIIEECFPPQPDCHISQERYLRPVPYAPGITLIKSDKGTGKTTVMQQLVSDVRSQRFPGTKSKDRPKTALLIGHRRALLQMTASKLGLEFYLDVGRVDHNPRLFAVCLDSLANFTDPYVYAVNGSRPLFQQDDAYDLIIIDESEQVLRHLVGDTIASKRGGLERCYDALHFQLTRAKAIFALDADLSMLTAHALRYLRPGDWQHNTRIFVNKAVVS